MPKTGLFLFQNEPETEEGPDHETHLEASEQVFTIQWLTPLCHRYMHFMLSSFISVSHTVPVLQFQMFRNCWKYQTPCRRKILAFLLILSKGCTFSRINGELVRTDFEEPRPELPVHLPKHYTQDLQISLRTSAPGHFWKLALNCWKVVFFSGQITFVEKKKIYISIVKSQNGVVFQTQDC